MSQESFLPERRIGRKLYLKPYSQAARAGLTWPLVGALFGLTSGFITLVFAMALTLLSRLVVSVDYSSFLHRFGTVLFLLTIPLLMFGAYCLDLSDDQSRAPHVGDSPFADAKPNDASPTKFPPD